MAKLAVGSVVACTLALGASFVTAGCGEPAAVSAEPSASASAKSDQQKPGRSESDNGMKKKAAARGETFGEPITVTEETALQSIAAAPDAFAEKPVRVRGKVAAVCQMAGCWTEIVDEESRAHIKMANHAFYVPKTCSGKMATVQGIVQSGPPANTCGDHDTCMGEGSGAVAKLEIVATGVELAAD